MPLTSYAPATPMPLGGPRPMVELLAEDPTRRLTMQERRVLELACHGLTRQQIATALGIGVDTAKTHLDAIRYKLDVPNTVAAAALWRAAHPRPDPTIVACLRGGRPIPRDREETPR